MTERSLILGASGFIGGQLTRTLARAGEPFRAFARTRPAHAPGDWLLGDFRNRADVEKALDDCSVVYHLISSTTPASSNQDPGADVRDNLVATIQLLDLARAARVRKVIFVSSGGTVYGVTPHRPVAETEPTRPICSYGISKLAVEHYLRLYERLHGLNYCVLRLANPYGAGQKSRTLGAVGIFLDRALRGEPIEIWGDGEVVRDYVYIHDAIEAMLLARDYVGEHRIFNIGSGVGRSLNQVVQELENVLGRPIARRYREARKSDVPVNILDVGLACRALGWLPRTSFTEGLRQTARMLQLDPRNAA